MIRHAYISYKSLNIPNKLLKIITQFQSRYHKWNLSFLTFEGAKAGVLPQNLKYFLEMAFGLILIEINEPSINAVRQNSGMLRDQTLWAIYSKKLTGATLPIDFLTNCNHFLAKSYGTKTYFFLNISMQKVL